VRALHRTRNYKSGTAYRLSRRRGTDSPPIEQPHMPLSALDVIASSSRYVLAYDPRSWRDGIGFASYDSQER